jgi:2-polyprenyl-3-methyl-5-hydroxy-6-metoxy-1,4-benzoquinol methylase
VVRFVRHRLPVEPSTYWRDRYRENGSALAGPGHLCLDEDANRRSYEEKYRALGGMLRRQLPRLAGRALLDAGCGPGAMFALYRELGFSITGVDFAPEALRFAVERGATEVVRSDLATLRLGRRFDVVCCIDVLFHVLDDQRWRADLATLAAHVADRGCVVVQESLVDPGCYRGVTRHCHFRTLGHYRAALREAGLVLEETTRYQLESEGEHKDILVLSRAADPGAS